MKALEKGMQPPSWTTELPKSYQMRITVSFFFFSKTDFKCSTSKTSNSGFVNSQYNRKYYRHVCS